MRWANAGQAAIMIFAVCQPSSAIASAGTSSHKHSPLPATVIEGRFGNGLEYIIDPTVTEPGFVNFRFVVRVGFWNEPEAFPELAHLIEHIIISQPVDGDTKTAFALVEEWGGLRGGDINATTSDTYTVYKLRVPSGKFKAALEILRAWATPRNFADETIDRERAAVSAEYMSGSSLDQAERDAVNTARGLNKVSLLRLRGIRDVPKTVVRSFHRAGYQPDRMAVIVTGDIAAPSALNQLRTAFEGLRANPKVNRLRTAEPKLRFPATIKVCLPGITRSRFEIAFKWREKTGSQDYHTAQKLRLRLLAKILNARALIALGSAASPVRELSFDLTRIISTTDREAVATAVPYPQQIIEAIGSVEFFVGSIQKNISEHELENAISDLSADLANESDPDRSDAYVEYISNGNPIVSRMQVRAQFEKLRQSLSANEMHGLARHVFASFSPARRFYDRPERCNSLPPPGVANASVTVPGGFPRWNDASFKPLPLPALGDGPSVRAPSIIASRKGLNGETVMTLGNGQVVVVDNENPTANVHIRLIGRGGADDVPSIRFEDLRAYFELYDYAGFRNLDRLQVRRWKADRGISSSFKLEEHRHVLDVYAPRERLGDAVAYVQAVSSGLDVNDDAFRLWKQDRLDRLFDGSEVVELERLASRVLADRAPWTQFDIDRLALEDIAPVADNLFVPGRSIMLVTGNVDPLAVVMAAARRPSDGHDADYFAVRKTSVRGGRYETFTNGDRALVELHYISENVSVDEAEALQLAGPTIETRLLHRLRDVEGSVYDVTGGATYDAHTGRLSLVMRFSCRAGSVDRAIKAARNEIDQMASERDGADNDRKTSSANGDRQQSLSLMSKHEGHSNMLWEERIEYLGSDRRFSILLRDSTKVELIVRPTQ